MKKIRKQFLVTEKQDAFLVEESRRTGLAETDIVRRLIDRLIEETEKRNKPF